MSELHDRMSRGGVDVGRGVPPSDRDRAGKAKLARRWAMPAAAMLMLAAAAFVHVGCSSGHASYSKESAKREAEPASPLDPRVVGRWENPSQREEWSNVGGGQNSLGLGETLPGQVNGRAGYVESPQFDLNALQQPRVPEIVRGTGGPSVDIITRSEDWPSIAPMPEAQRPGSAKPGDLTIIGNDLTKRRQLVGDVPLLPDIDDYTHGFSGRGDRESPADYRLDAARKSEDLERTAARARLSEYRQRYERAQASPFTTRATTEVWVIERTRFQEPAPIDDGPGCGSLVTTLPDRSEIVPVPLKHTEVNAAIEGFISSVTVTQQFSNPYSSKIEAVYVFPLPENAAVSEFLMTVGDRTIRGIVRERGEAERVYQQARAQGYVASLMTQERPNIFTQRVANIEPGKSIDVNVTYYSTLTFADGAYEFVFPMVVGPRFNPPSGNGTGVGAIGVGTAPGSSGQATEVSYLRPDMRSGHDIGINVDIDAWVDIERIECATHAVEVSNRAGSRAHVRLLPSDSVPNRDFVLRTVVAGDQVKSRLITHRDERGGFFSLMLVPPRDLKYTRRGPVEMVYVLDCSGSMSGRPMEQAKAAVERGLSRLEPMDTFQIIDFAESASRLGTRPLAATPENVRQAREYLASLGAGGGTMMLTGLKASLGFPHDPQRLRYVAFLTDGYIGNEQEILTCQAREQRDSRVFSFGVGTSVNRALMDSMARVGRGVTAYVAAGDSPTEVMDLFHDRVAAAALCDISVEWGSAGVKDVFPSRTPDLFVGRPVILTGRFDGDFSGEIVVNGRAGGEKRTLRIKPEAGGIFGMRTPALPTSGVRAANAGGNGAVDATPPAYGIRTVSDPRPSTDDARPGEWSHDGGRPRVAPVARGMNPLPQVWARMKLADLADRSVFDPGAWIGPEMEETALRFSLLSPRTAFVAVDSMTRTDGSFGTTVNVPVPVPQGVRYETTVTEK